MRTQIAPSARFAPSVARRSARAAWLPVVCIAAAHWASTGCGDDAHPLDDDPRRNVMVIDDGFDTSLPVFRGKVAASYTIECREEPGVVDGGPDTAGGGDPDGGADAGGAQTFDQEKAALLAELAKADDACNLAPGIARKENPLADIEGLRARWNARISNDVFVWRFLQPDPDYVAIVERLADARIHGTATSGIIAHGNTVADMVLVEQPIKSFDEVVTGFECLTQDSIDRAVALLSDLEVRRAYIQRPMSTLDRLLVEARGLHGVGIVSESFGILSRYSLETIQLESACQPVSLRAWFGLQTELERDYELAHPEPGVLLIKAAGNGESLLNGPEDSIECRPEDPLRLLVGGTDPGGRHAYFTNFGRCVDVFARGSDVVSYLPGGWLFPFSGTSFSAPLVARLLLLSSPLPFDATTARAALFDKRQPNRAILDRHFPPDLLYDAHLGGKQQLTLAGGIAPSHREPVNRVALRKALWPIRWLQRHQVRR